MADRGRIFLSRQTSFLHCFVGRGESLGDVREQVQGLGRRQRTILQQGCQGITVHVLHDDRARGVVRVEDVVHLDHRRVVELGDRLRFTDEAFPGPGARRSALRLQSLRRQRPRTANACERETRAR